MLNGTVQEVLAPRLRVVLAGVLAVGLAACGQGPADSEEVSSANDLRGQRYANVDAMYDLHFGSRNEVTLLTWAGDDAVTHSFAYEGEQLQVDWGNEFVTSFRKSGDGGWIGRDPFGSARLRPETGEIAEQRSEFRAMVEERLRLLAERPGSLDAYHRVETENDWRMLYAAHATHMTEEELAAFLIPGYGTERDAFRKRELFGQLEALQPELEKWRERRFIQIPYGTNSPIRGYPRIAAYSFEHEGFPLSAPSCDTTNVVMPGNVQVHFIRWEDGSCVVQLPEAEAREVEGLRNSHTLELDTTAYMLLMPHGDRRLDFDVHRIDVRFSKPVRGGRFNARTGNEVVAQATLAKTQ